MLYPRSLSSPLMPTPTPPVSGPTPFPNQPVNGAPIGTTAPTPFDGTGGTITPNGQTDPAAIRAWVIQTASAPGGDRSILNDPDYWVQQIASHGGLSAGNAGYFADRMRPGAGGGSGGNSPIGLGQFLQPYTGTFSAPNGTDDPGFQFALKEGTDAIQRSAAAKGNLLTGGVLKDLASFTTGSALKDYAGSYDRALSTFGANYGVFRNNQQDPFNRLFDASRLGVGAASSYAAGQTGLTTDRGNVGAASTATAANALNPAITAFGNWFQRRYAPGTGTGTGAGVANPNLPPANSTLTGG